MSLLTSILGIGADVAASGGVGTVVGGVLGIGQKIWATKLEHEEKQRERTHELALLGLQHDQDVRLAQYKLQEIQIGAIGSALTASYDHDASFKSSSRVSDIRALVRPTITVYALVAAGFNPEVYSGFAGVMISWWFAARVRVEPLIR